MESIARDKFNLLKNKFFKKDANHVTNVDGEESSGLLNDSSGSSNVSLPKDSINSRGNDDSDTDEENKTVGLVLQKFNNLKSRFFNKSEYKNVNDQEEHATAGNHSYTENNSVSTDDEPEIAFRAKKEISIFKDNFQKLKNKLFKDNTDGFENIHLINDPLNSNWLQSKDATKTTVLTRSSDVRNFFANDSDSDDGFGVGNGDVHSPRGNFFDSCAEDEHDDDDTEVELFSYPEEKLSLLDRRHESEELLNMNDVDVIDLQADGSAVNLNVEESPDDLILRKNRNRKMERSYNVYLIVAAFMAALGGMLFGYDTGIVSGALLQLTDDFGLLCFQQETVVSSLLIGAILASLTGGFIIDYMGRRVTIIINAMVFILGAIILCLSPNFATLVVGRLIVGFGVSLSASAECIYISEISPAHIRGRLVSLNELGITIGFLLAYSTSFIFIHIDKGWRYMFGLSAIPAVLQGIGMFFMPPSPRFLFMTGKPAEAQIVLQKIHGKCDYETEMSSIQSAQISYKGKQIFELCSSMDNMRSRLAIGMAILFFQQFTGQPSVLYYAPTLFQSIGYGSDTAATLATVGLGVVKVVITVISLLIVDRCGRRCLLLVGTGLMLLGITMLGITTIATPYTVHDPCTVPAKLQGSALLHEQSNNTLHSITMTTPETITTPAFSMTTIETSPVTSNNNNTQLTKRDLSDVSNFHIMKRGSQVNLSDENSVISNGNETDDSKKLQTGSGRWFSLIALMMYIAGYAVGFGPVAWLILSEIFPSHVRGRAISVATIFNWGTNLLVALTFLNLMISWLLLSELFPSHVRGRAISMATVFNWGANLIVALTFLSIMSALNVSGIFFLYGGICLLSLLFIFVFVPETKGRTLEQLSHQLQSRQFIMENVTVCKCCTKDEDQEAKSLHSVDKHSPDYSALQNETGQ